MPRLAAEAKDSQLQNQATEIEALRRELVLTEYRFVFTVCTDWCVHCTLTLYAACWPECALDALFAA